MGRDRSAEAKLGECPHLLCDEHRELITAWWLSVRKNANTPNWDIATTATIDGRDGLVLVEAKAHSNELKVNGKPPGNPLNHARIALAIGEANLGLMPLYPVGSYRATRTTSLQTGSRGRG